MSIFAVQVLAQATTQPWHGLGRPTTWQDAATIISGVVAVVSGVATVAAVIVAVWAVRQTQKQIRANEQSGAQQRKDIEKQQEQIERQLAIQSEQAITGPFFEMLAMLQSIVDATFAVSNGTKVEGWHAFLTLYQRFIAADAYRIGPPEGGDAEQRRIQISSKYRLFHSHNQISLSHYFRFLYNVVKYVHASKLDNDPKLDEKKKRDLIRLLRSQFSQEQLLLLFYNGITEELGYPKFFKFIREYRLLDNLDSRPLGSDSDLYERLPMPPE